MPASPNDNDLKKQALMRLIGQYQQPTSMVHYPNGNPVSSPAMAADSVLGAPIRRGLWQASHEQNKPENGFLSTAPITEGLKAAYNQFGQDPRTAPTAKQTMMEAGMSSLPGSQTPGLQSIYRQPGEKTDAFDVRPEAGGMLDFSPAGVAGEALNFYTDPMMHTGAPKTMGASVQKASWPNLKKTLNPEEYSALLRKDPKVQEFLDQEAQYGTVPYMEKSATENELQKNKNIIGSSKSTGEDTAIIEEKPDKDEEEQEE